MPPAAAPPAPPPPPPIAEPLHLQRLEAALDMGPFMSYARHQLSQPLSSDEDSNAESEQNSQLDKSSDPEEYAAGRRRRKRLLGTKQGMMAYSY